MSYGDYYKSGGGYTSYREGGGIQRGSSSTAKRSWWEKELDYGDEFDDSKYAGRNISSVGSYFGSYGNSTWSRSFGSSIEDKLDKVSIAIGRLLNACPNQAGNSDKALWIKWSKSEKNEKEGTKEKDKFNNPDSDRVVLSPTHIIGKTGSEDNSSDPEIVDAVGGQALIAATMKKTSSMASFKSATDDKSDQKDLSRHLWSAAETAIAKNDLLSGWPGFAPYIARHAKLMTDGKDDVQKFVDENMDTLPGAVAAASWKLMNPREPLTLSETTDKAVNEALERFDLSDGSSRYATCKDVVSHLRSVFHWDPPKGGGGGGSGEPEKKEEEDKGKPPTGGAGSPSEEPKKKPSEPPPGGGGKPDEKEDEGPKVPMPRIGDDELTTKKPDPGNITGMVPDEISTKDDDVKCERPKIPKGCAYFSKPNVIKAVPLNRSDIGSSFGRGSYKHWKRSVIQQIEDRKEALYHPKYIDLVRASKPITNAILSSLRFRATSPTWPVHGLRSGDLDSGSFDKLVLKEQSPTIFERNDSAIIPDVSIAILIDESGSMSGGTGVVPKFVDARLVAVAMREAFTKLKGINLMVYGHTIAIGEPILFEYITSSKDDPSVLSAISSHMDNADGAAIEEVVNRLSDHYPHSKKKYVFVISDGQPAASGYSNRLAAKRCDSSNCGAGKYGDEPAFTHMKSVCDWAKLTKCVSVYGIGVQGQPGQKEGDLMYGKGRFICLNDVKSSARIIAAFLAQVTRDR